VYCPIPIVAKIGHGVANCATAHCRVLASYFACFETQDVVRGEDFSPSSSLQTAALGLRFCNPRRLRVARNLRNANSRIYNNREPLRRNQTFRAHLECNALNICDNDVSAIWLKTLRITVQWSEVWTKSAGIWRRVSHLTWWYRQQVLPKRE
jgi:hypothetical protein